MSEDEDEKPCGSYHPLPCGLDRDCEVPVAYFTPTISNEKIYTDYKNDEN